MRNTTYKQYALSRAKKNRIIKRTGVTLSFLAPYLVCFVMFFIIPFVTGLLFSTAKFSSKSIYPEKFFYFDNFKNIFNFKKAYSRNFWNAVGHTLLFAIVIVPLCMIIPFFLALATSVKPKGYKFFRACIYLPGIFPLTATGLILLRMFSKENGFVNGILGKSIDWFGNPALAWLMVGFFCIWGGIGGNYIIMNAGLENVDKTLYEAGKMDGVSFWQKMRYITLPGVKPQLVLCLFTTLIGYMNLYGQNFILTSNTPDQQSVKTAIFAIQDMLTGGSARYGFAAAMAVCLGVIIGVFSALQMLATSQKKGGKKHAKEYQKWLQEKQS